MLFSMRKPDSAVGTRRLLTRSVDPVILSTEKREKPTISAPPTIMVANPADNLDLIENKEKIFIGASP